MSSAECFGQLDACFEPFSTGVKHQARDKAHNKCEICHKRGGLEVHHDVPQVYNGKDSIDNAKVLCKKCHVRADLNVIEYGITTTGHFLNELPEFRFKNNYNPYKNIDISKIPIGWRHDRLMIANGKHTRDYYDKYVNKKKHHK